MRKTYQIPDRASIHIIEHFAGNYFGSASFLLDLAARISNPERIVLVSHSDISGGEFSDMIRQRFININKDIDKVGRIVCVDPDGVEEAAFNNEVGLLPGMEMIILVNGNSLSGALKYVYNTSKEISKWVSVISTIQCGFGKTFRDILKRECAIGSCLYNEYLDCYVYEENRLPHKLMRGDTTSFNDIMYLCQSNPIVSNIMGNTPIPMLQFNATNAMVDTLSS